MYGFAGCGGDAARLSVIPVATQATRTANTAHLPTAVPNSADHRPATPAAVTAPPTPAIPIFPNEAISAPGAAVAAFSVSKPASTATDTITPAFLSVSRRRDTPLSRLREIVDWLIPSSWAIWPCVRPSR